MTKTRKVLAVDIGTGTQDIYLYDSRQDLENGFKLILPSPTMIIFRRLQQATARRQPILLTGRLMGGGPSSWGAEAHLKAGLPLFATPAAALSFNDDLSIVQEMGVKILAEEEVARLPADICTIELGISIFPPSSAPLWNSAFGWIPWMQSPLPCLITAPPRSMFRTANSVSITSISASARPIA